MTPGPGPNYRAVTGTVEVRKDGRLIETLHPEKRIYNASGQTDDRRRHRHRLTGDRYVSLGEPLADDDSRRVGRARLSSSPSSTGSGAARS